MNVEHRTRRLHTDDSRPDTRFPFQRDRDRILYSSAFRRLGWITQVVSADEGQPFHNRLTHTLEVAQIGRRLAENLTNLHPEDAESLGGIDADVVEASALAHDLGHPPFGHTVEEELDILVKCAGLKDGFEGNAQSFRIVTKLSVRRTEFTGLNLTRATLNATLKYPWLRAKIPPVRDRKWGAYASESKEFEWVRKHDEAEGLKSVEAEIMDLADDIAYAVHDVEDFYRAGQIPLDRLRSDEEEIDKFLDGAFNILEMKGERSEYGKSDCKKSLRSLLTGFRIAGPYSGTRQQRATLRAMTAQLIGGYVSGVTLDPSPLPHMPRVRMDEEKKINLFVFKQLPWHYVIHSAALATQQHGQRRIVRELFEIFQTAASDQRHKRLEMFPESHRERLRQLAGSSDKEVDEERTRIVSDFISSMTDQQAVAMHQRLRGVSLGAAMNSIVG